jgi:hypothetical protein
MIEPTQPDSIPVVVLLAVALGWSVIIRIG